MNGWVILGLFVWTVAVFVVGFFVGGKHKENLLQKVGLLKETSGTIAEAIRDARKKF